MSKWGELCKKMEHAIQTGNMPLTTFMELKEEGDKLQAKLIRVEELANKWANTKPSPYDNAYSDPSLAVRLPRLYGLDLKSIIESVASDSKRMEGL